MVEASQLLLGKIDKLVQSKSNNKFDYDNIRKISFTVDCIIVYLNNNNINCNIEIKYSEIIDSK
jgi:hypothetical protein